MALFDILDSGFFRPRNVVPAVLALLVGVLAWFGIRPALTGEDAETVVAEAPAPAPVPPPAPEPRTVYPSVLVAKRQIESGVMVHTELVDWVEWRDPIDMNIAVVKDAVPLQAILGAVSMRSFSEGEMLTWNGLVLPGSPGFITAVLTPGRRAVTVEVDRATTNAKIIYPGDHVDVIMVANVDAGGSVAEGGPAAQRIVRDVRILAVGSTIMSLGRYGKASLKTAGFVEPVTPPTGETYTLEVLPKDAERISLAANTGRLTLAIRPILGSPGATDASTPVRFEEVMGPPKPAYMPPRVRVIRGGGVEDETVTLGSS